MLRAIIIILVLSVSGTAFATIIIKGQMQVKNLTVNTSSSSGGGGGEEDIEALTQEDTGLLLQEDTGVLLYD